MNFQNNQYMVLLIIFITTKPTQSCPSLCVCDYYAAVHTIDCSSQDLVTLPTDIPEWTTSFTFDGNELTTLNFSVINTTVYFEEFQIRYNMINYILLTSRDRILNYPSLRGACSHVIRTFPRLKRVNLRGNQLEKLPKCLLFAWPILEVLNLDENEFTSLNALHFTDHVDYKDSMKELSMRRNRITSVRRQHLFSPVSALRRLQVLDLSENQIIKVEPKSFFFLKELQVLRLEGNLISVLQDFTFITKGKKLQEIKLARNQIMKIRGHSFAGLPSLQLLDLSHNNITCLQPGTFATCGSDNGPLHKRYQYLLSRHPIHFQNELRVNVDSNHWYCDCQLKPLLTNQEQSNTIQPRINYEKCFSSTHKFISTELTRLNCN